MSSRREQLAQPFRDREKSRDEKWRCLQEETEKGLAFKAQNWPHFRAALQDKLLPGLEKLEDQKIKPARAAITFPPPWSRLKRKHAGLSLFVALRTLYPSAWYARLTIVLRLMALVISLPIVIALKILVVLTLFVWNHKWLFVIAAALALLLYVILTTPSLP